MYQEGDIAWETIPEFGSKKAIEMAADIMEADIADWGLRLSADGTAYKYHGSDEEVIETDIVEISEER